MDRLKLGSLFDGFPLGGLLAGIAWTDALVAEKSRCKYTKIPALSLCTLCLEITCYSSVLERICHYQKGRKPRREQKENGGQHHEREADEPGCGDEKADHRGRGRDEQHHPPGRRQAGRRVLRHRALRGYSQPQWLLHLVGLGYPRPRMEIPKGCQHPRAGQRKVRVGYPNPHLR